MLKLSRRPSGFFCILLFWTIFILVVNIVFPVSGSDSKAEMVRVLLEADEETTLSIHFDGVISKLLVSEGDRVRKGDVLIRLDCRIHKARKMKATADWEIAKSEYESKVILHNNRTGNKRDVSVAKFEVNKAKANQDIMAVMVERCVVKAPHNGVVAKLLARPYETASKGQPLIELINNDTIYARLIVSSISLQWLSPGTPFTFKLDETNKLYEARIYYIDNRIDPISQTVMLKARILEKHNELLPGMGGFVVDVPKLKSKNSQ
jgi:membrane fusion protein, multidrug efflux system